MALGPIGNTIFVNQMTASVASIQNTHSSRVELQNIMAQSAINERDEKVLKVRPTEENQEVNEDKEHQRQEADRETQRSKKQEKDDASQELDMQNFTLDIIV